MNVSVDAPSTTGIRPALHIIKEPRRFNGVTEFEEVGRERVVVYPMTSAGVFRFEREDGTCGTEQPDRIKFLDSDRLFSKFDWDELENGGSHARER